MGRALILVGLAGLVVAAWGLIRGRVGWARIASRKAAGGVLAASFLLSMVGGAVAGPSAPKEPPAPKGPQAPAEAVQSQATTAPPVPSLPPTSLASPAADPAKPPAPVGVPSDAQPAVVERIVDGDTLWVRVDHEGSGPLIAGASHDIRLLEIDTPETKDPGKPVQCFGPEASRFAQETLRIGSRVWLVADKEDTDRYGRFLRYLWTDQGVFFNVEAVRQGYARAVLYAPNDAYIRVMRVAEAEAKASGRGMWGPPCDYDAPPPPPPPAPLPASAPAPAATPVATTGPSSTPTLAPLPAPPPQAGCDPNYSGACVPPYPPDVNCKDIPVQDFRVVGSDPHRLDADHDGIACES